MEGQLNTQARSVKGHLKMRYVLCQIYRTIFRGSKPTGNLKRLQLKALFIVMKHHKRIYRYSAVTTVVESVDKDAYIQ